MLTVNKAASLLKMSDKAVRRLIREKKIPVTRVGNRAYISEDWLRLKMEKYGSFENENADN